MGIAYWLVFAVGLTVIVTGIFRLVWLVLSVPLMVLGAIFSLLFGVLPVVLLVAIAAGVIWACLRLPVGALPDRRRASQAWRRFRCRW